MRYESDTRPQGHGFFARSVVGGNFKLLIDQSGRRQHQRIETRP